MSHVLTLAWGGAITLVAWMIGRALLRLAGHDLFLGEEERIEFPLAVAMGLGGIMMVVYLVGLAGGLYILPFRLAVAAGGGVGLLSLVRLGRPGAAGGWSVPRSVPSVLTAGVIGILVYAAFGPQTGIDPLNYHLWGPQEYLRHHRIVSPEDNIQCFGFHAMSMLYLLGLLLDGEHLASLLTVVVAAAGLLLLYRAGVRQGDGRAAAWATALLATSPVFLIHGNHAKADAGAVLMCLGTAICWLRFVEDDRRDERWFRIGSVFAGLALTVKIQAGYTILPMLGWVCSRSRRTPGDRGTFRRAVLAGALMAVCLLPWAFRNFMATGDPLFPLLSPWLARTPELGLAAEEWKIHSRSVGPGLGAGLVTNLLLPVSLVFRDDGMGGTQFGWMGLGLWGLLAWVCRRHRSAAMGLWTGVGAFALWYFTTRRARYLLPAFAVGFLGAVSALEEMGRRSRWLFVGMLCGAVMLDNGLVVLASGDLRVPPPAVVFGRLPEREWAAREDPVFAAARLVEERVPRAGKVVVLGDERLRYLTTRQVVVHTHFQRSVFWTDLAAAGSVADLERRLAGRGISHVLLDEPQTGAMFGISRVLRISPRQRALFDEFRGRWKDPARAGPWVLGRIGP